MKHTLLTVGVLIASVLSIILWRGRHDREQVPEQFSLPKEQDVVMQEPDLYGLLKSVDGAGPKFTLAIATEEGNQLRTYELAKEAVVLLEGPARLDQLPIGTRVAVVLRPDRNEIVAIRSEPFRISVDPKQHEVEVGKPFDVVLRVANATGSPQSFWVMLTTWDMDWKASNPLVVWDPLFSYGNGPVLIKLAPGEIYEKSLPMKVSVAGRVSFKMGFTPLADKRAAILGELNLGKRTYWSPEVTLEVR